MQLLPLTSDLEGRFWSVVEADYCDYYFFIYDWLLQRSKTKIFLAQENDAVEGLMVVYDEHIAQLRGNKAAVQFMLQKLLPDVTDVQVPFSSEKLLFEIFPSAKLKAQVTLFRLNKGQEQLTMSTKPHKLGANDAADMSS